MEHRSGTRWPFAGPVPDEGDVHEQLTWSVDNQWITPELLKADEHDVYVVVNEECKRHQGKPVHAQVGG